MEFLICFLRVKKVLPLFFSLKVSPIQKIMFNFSLRADLIFFFINWFVSPSDLLSECPKIINYAPALLSIDEFTEPVKRP